MLKLILSNVADTKLYKKGSNHDISVYLFEEESAATDKIENIASEKILQMPLKNQALSKIKKGEFHDKIQDISAEKIAKIVKNVDLNDPNAIYKVCANLLKNETIDWNYFFSQLKNVNSNEHQMKEYSNIIGVAMGNLVNLIRTA